MSTSAPTADASETRLALLEIAARFLATRPDAKAADVIRWRRAGRDGSAGSGHPSLVDGQQSRSSEATAKQEPPDVRAGNSVGSGSFWRRGNEDRRSDQALDTFVGGVSNIEVALP